MSLDEKRPLGALPDWPAAMDARAAADYAGISRSLFDRLRPVRPRYIAGAMRYLRRELDAWLESLPDVPPADPLPADREAPGDDIDAGPDPAQPRRPGSTDNRERKATRSQNLAQALRKLHERQVAGP